jgi:4-alpha-glucanotransferase
VVYTGTHDNPASRGWWDEASLAARQRASALLGCDGSGFVDALIKGALSSEAGWAFVPAQDLLNLGNSARTNTPGTVEGNWDWRLGTGDLSESLAAKLAGWLAAAGRG